MTIRLQDQGNQTMTTQTADFFEIEVTTVTMESDSVAALTLSRADGGELPTWEPGAHIDVLLPNGMLRQYSLCGQPSPGAEWRIAVLREPAGRGGSAYVFDELRPGAVVQVRAPRNNFALAPAPEYVLIAGGIGITPILAMARELAAGTTPWRLFYLGRSRSSMAFLDEVAALGGDVSIHADDEDGIFPLADLLSDADADFHLYVCGPGGLLKAVQGFVDGWSDPSRFHFERFVADPEVAAAVDHTGDHEFMVELQDGSEILVPADVSILKALEDAGYEVLNSCREGICGTCETPVIAGEIEHRDQLLSEDERAAGDTMMICVSRCRGKRLVLGL